MADNPELHELDRMHARIDRLEAAWLLELKDVNSKLTALAVSFAGKRECPDPGACITMKESLTSAHLRVNLLAARIENLEKWRYAAMVLIGLGMSLLTLFGPIIRKLLRLE